MSARLFFDSDCDIKYLSGKTICFAGYGNQGRAQAQNIRDTLKEYKNLSSPPKIVIANRSDSYASNAEEDGFGYTTDWAYAASIADVLFLLVPDQVQPKLFNEEIAPTLKSTACIVVASGYNVFYKYLSVNPTNDVVMLAPRMIGTSVRSRFVSGEGFPCFVSVEQDGTGNAWAVTLALSRAVGATKGGVIESSCREETLLDLFAEQAMYPMIIAAFREGYKVLKNLGCSDEAIVHEMWLSKEPSEVFEKCADDGFVNQLVHHSTVSQYGQLKGSMEVDTSLIQKEFSRVAKDRILGGSFAAEFSQLDKERENGVMKKLDELYDLASQNEMIQGEKRVRERLGLSTDRKSLV